MHILRPILAGSLLLSGASVALAVEQRPGVDPEIARSAHPHHVYLVGELRVMQAWIDVDRARADKADAYLVVENRGATPERLTAAQTDAADHVAVIAKGGGDASPGAGVTIPPHSTVTLQPDDAHLELDGLHGDLHGKGGIAGVLDFEKAGPLHIQFATTHTDALREDQTDPAQLPPASLVK